MRFVSQPGMVGKVSLLNVFTFSFNKEAAYLTIVE
jgi:hypothetical protein